MKWGLKTNFLAVLMIVIVGLAIFAASLPWPGPGNVGGKQHDLNTFSSFEELQEFLNAESKDYYEYDFTFFGSIDDSNSGSSYFRS